MEAILEPNPRVEIIKKIAFGITISIIIVIIDIVLNRKEFSFNEVGLVLFLTGGIFLVIGGFRDILESIVIRKVRGQNISDYLSSSKRDYFYGFGKAGEDVVAGTFLIILSFITVLF